MTIGSPPLTGIKAIAVTQLIAGPTATMSSVGSVPTLSRSNSRGVIWRDPSVGRKRGCHDVFRPQWRSSRSRSTCLLKSAEAQCRASRPRRPSRAGVSSWGDASIRSRLEALAQANPRLIWVSSHRLTRLAMAASGLASMQCSKPLRV